MMSNPPVTINLVVLNGEKYIRYFLDSLKKQTYPHDKIQFNILDNGSIDNTVSIIESYKLQATSYKQVNFVKNKINLGMWPGQEELLKYTDGQYIIASAVDIILDKDFIRNSIEIMGKETKIGAIQAKIYKYDLVNNEPELTNIIDTTGFKIFRSRRIINIGHGEEDNGQYDKLEEIFAVEGAVPIFRTEAFKSLKVSGEITDHDYFWYGDDLDLAWRMQLFGWKQVFAPDVIAWHDRQTTKSVKKSWSDYITRVPVRKQIPIQKRRLDWRNTRWTLIKNDHIINILKDLPWIVLRETAVLGYTILFEPGVLKEIPKFFKHLPAMLRKRKEIMKRAVANPKDIRKWIN
ncbi:MAG: hypothetical protein A2655_04190 [Candidatus Yanofskybacteria bacterium RIFCSPHIGHO2_01_FULL_43_42]|uniref:Glycosyltransferase 2-like domain-containing protein n=1 Tax=Candidatus Yanofskybacteria bacterium RIFCSPLOWO2_01_FULL_43_22 TaxID=1802695 RepID=A0A1F8GD63_9BACT|nr:MAG: hypothetical protein A2655_04190 [Candidatus Yanofskybacteria bacterium RIFCSPHIGHO2_01_FULL_43_42]OGN12693.1 MAG: hypothetical protein A3D48_01540 [Candidatus Yanofskybacteria bacterium RIFCSPHIGHO2_02_FULL_43_17]OGN23315.1 MAG: hypothetical protein A3A13_04310 [Candidatus Yanofskybacteria bacterium RIFCSPLOWO2_01_FULL_43_22]